MAKSPSITSSGSKRRDGFGDTIVTVIYAILVALVIRTFLYEPFNIPSGSMVPTLLVGDYLFVSKFSYGYSKHSFPFSLAPFSGRLIMTAPKRGDVIVFKLPRDNKTDFVKRLIGLPGDTVRMQDGRLFINGQLVDRQRIDEYPYHDDETGKVVNLTRYREILPGGKEHMILEEGDNKRFDNTPEFKVPEGNYFMMGDNRDHSADSRSEVGYVPAENLVGRAEFLFFSTDGSASIVQFWKWPFAIRFGRFFTGIR